MPIFAVNGPCERFEDGIVCPKPLKTFSSKTTLGAVKPLCQCWSIPDVGVKCEAGNEILEIFFSKNSPSDAPNISCSHPYFAGSPPRRAGNPIIHDVQFMRDSGPPSATSSPVKAKLLAAPSPGGNRLVRIEGFDCSGHGFERAACDVRRHVPAFA